MNEEYLYLVEVDDENFTTPIVHLFESEQKADEAVEVYKAGGTFIRKMVVKIIREEK